MNISTWNLYYKIHEAEGRPTTTQMCYEPRVNPEGNVFCMNFVYPCEYQSNQPRLSYTQEHVESMFQRELRYLEIFKDKEWAPEVLDIKDHKIFIKWYGGTCNEMVYRDFDLELRYPNWYSDVERIILDQVADGYLKSTMYPHSHYYDSNGNMRAIDFYATVEKANPFLSYEEVSSLIGFDTDRFSNAKDGNMLNIETIFKSGLLQYSKWPLNLSNIYSKIYVNE